MNDLRGETLDFLREAKGAHDAPAGAKERVRAAVSMAVAAPLAAGMAGAAARGAGASRWTGAVKAMVMIAAIAGAGAALLVGRSAATHHTREGMTRGMTAAVSTSETRSAGTPVASSALGSSVRWGTSGTAGTSAESVPGVPSGLHAQGPSNPSSNSSSAIDGLTPIDPSTLPRVVSTPARSGAGSHATRAGAADGSVAAEFALLRRVSAALKNGDAHGALAGVHEHARRFPHGVLAEERDTDRILALCALGKRDEAARATERFDRSYPDSAHGARVHSACAAAPDDGDAEQP